MTGREPVYLDYAASSPVLPEVVEAMLPYLSMHYGNPSSIHATGRAARAAVDLARDQVAGALGVDHSEITFTSGATEANNLALLGLATELPLDRVIAISAAEHHSVLAVAGPLRDRGREVTTLPVSSDGLLALADLQSCDRIGLISAMHVNNETGAVNDVAAIGRWASSRSSLYHMDGVQSLGRLPIRLRGIGCDSASFSGHKIGGPKGAGALYVRRGVAVRPQMAGGRQERERRPGTENVAAIVGLGLAAQLAAERRESEVARLTRLAEYLIEGITAVLPSARVVAERAQRVPGIVCVTGDWGSGADMVMALDHEGIAVSSGAACSSGAIEPSHVLLAQGLGRAAAESAVRFSMGHRTTESEVVAAASAMGRCARCMADYRSAR